MLCWLIWKSRDEGGCVEATIAQIQEETGMSEKNIETALTKLSGVVTRTQRRMEHRTFYVVEADALNEKWEKVREGLSRKAETASRTKGRNGLSGEPETASRTNGLRTEVRTEEPPIVPIAKSSVSKESKAGNQAKALVQAFAGVYRERFRGDYVPHPKRDTAAASALASAGVTGEQVADRFRAATRIRGGFWCAKANCLPVLADHWNEIGAEIVGQGRNLEAGVEPGSSESDPSEWVRSMENLPDVTR